MGSPEVETPHHVRAGEVRGMGLKIEEGSASQDSVRPASWQQQHKQHAGLLLRAQMRAVAGNSSSRPSQRSRVSQAGVISKCCRRNWTRETAVTPLAEEGRGG